MQIANNFISCEEDNAYNRYKEASSSNNTRITNCTVSSEASSHNCKSPGANSTSHLLFHETITPITEIISPKKKTHTSKESLDDCIIEYAEKPATRTSPKWIYTANSNNNNNSINHSTKKSVHSLSSINSTIVGDQHEPPALISVKSDEQKYTNSSHDYNSIPLRKSMAQVEPIQIETPLPIPPPPTTPKQQQTESSKKSQTKRRKKEPKIEKYARSAPYRNLKHPTEKNIFFDLFKQFFFLIINFLLIGPIFLLILLFLPIKLIKYIAFKLTQLKIGSINSSNRPDANSNGASQSAFTNETPTFLTPMELFWLQESKHNKSVCTSALFIDGLLSKNLIKDLIHNRILSASSRNGKRLFPRFTQYIEHSWALGYVWKHAENFSIDDHIHELPVDIHTMDELQQYLSQLINTPIDTSKPLWRLYFKHNFGPERNTVIIFAYHMSFADGISLIRILFKSVADNRLTMDIKPRFAYRNLYINMLKQFMFDWYRLFYHLVFKKRDVNLLHVPKMSGRKVICWSEPFNFVNLNRMKLVTRSTMNDLLLSIISGIVRKYLNERGVTHPGDLHALMSVNLSSNKYPFRVCNRTALTTFRLPANTEGCIPRLWSVRETSAAMKSSADYLSLYLLTNIFYNLLPQSLASMLMHTIYSKNSLMISSLGAGNANLSSVSITNKIVKSILFFQPAVSDVALSCSVVTYGEETRLCVVADSEVMIKPEILTREFVAQLEVLRDLLANRRIPGEIRKAIKEPLNIRPAVINLVNMPEDTPIEEIQSKMSEIQLELQILTNEFNNLDKTSAEFHSERKRITIKLEQLRKEFRSMFSKVEHKTGVEPHPIPSDDEDELDPEVRTRLRSASIASRVSLNSHNKTHKIKHHDSHSSHDAHEITGLEPFNSNQFKQGSVSYASGLSTMNEKASVNRSHSSVTEKHFRLEA